MLHRAAGNAYSWWWASHIRTKQSKWLDQNLQDMEEKVDYILHIIHEDGDSFAVRAEMYYKKRPEIVNFVEDAFKGYRALAERYDHISKELQSANRTIASVYPESDQLPMDEDEDNDEDETRNSPKIFRHFLKVHKPSQHLPDVPTISILKTETSIPKKNARSSSRLMSKKALIKMGCAGTDATAGSGLGKAEALQEINCLQKRILAHQTEKEFVKSSYENSLAKFRDLEKEVTEMQVRVCSLQHEFGVGTDIEDYEAQALMAATAIKSCQEALNCLQEKQVQSIEEARLEYQRIQESREKFTTLKKQLREIQMNGQELPEEHNNVVMSPELNNFDTMGDDKAQEIYNLEFLKAKIKEELQVNADESFKMSELAEKVEELVDTIIKLETALSSQHAMVTRLQSERNDLQEHIQRLEEENENPAEGSEEVNSKIRTLGEELSRVQSLQHSLKAKNKKLQSDLIQTRCNVDHLSEKLPSAKPDEEVGNMDSFKIHAGLMLQDIVNYMQSGRESVPDFHTETVRMGEGENDEIFRELDSSNPINLFDEANFSLSSSRNPFLERQNSPFLEGMRGVPGGISIEQYDKFTNMIDPNHDSVIREEVKQHKIKEEEVEAKRVSCLRTSCKDGEGKPMQSDSSLNESFKTLNAVASSCDPSTSEHVKSDDKDMKQGLTSQGKDENKDIEPREVATEEEDEPNWKELFLHGLEDKEKLLLREYISTLRNYKEVKKKMNEVEKRNRASLFKYAVQLKVLKNTNASKTSQIESLQGKLGLLQHNWGETPDTNGKVIQEIEGDKTSPGHQETPSVEDEASDRETCTDEGHSVATIEEKIRIDLDDLLEDNMEFWLRFSTSIHQTLKFRTAVSDLEAELVKLKEGKKQDASNKHHHHQPLNMSDVRPIYRHLREIQTEMTLWLDHNEVFKEDLQNRLSSLSNIQEEILRLLKSGTEEETGLSHYQAAKFLGEVMNMMQENKKVSSELLTGLERVRGLQSEIEKTLEKLDEELGLKNQDRPRIPLRSFLFGVKLRKQRQSLLNCISPRFRGQ